MLLMIQETRQLEVVVPDDASNELAEKIINLAIKENRIQDNSKPYCFEYELPDTTWKKVYCEDIENKNNSINNQDSKLVNKTVVSDFSKEIEFLNSNGFLEFDFNQFSLLEIDPATVKSWRLPITIEGIGKANLVILLDLKNEKPWQFTMTIGFSEQEGLIPHCFSSLDKLLDAVIFECRHFSHQWNELRRFGDSLKNSYNKIVNEKRM